MDDLKLIKKYYGEKMMHLCRQLFPTILEKEGLLFSIFDSNFAHSKVLYDDISLTDEMIYDFKAYIYSLIDHKLSTTITSDDPFELLRIANYDLYECKSEDEIQSFKKYYAKDEALCTFKGGRLNSNYVFFAVKKNVDEIKRENFKEIHRQDEYGTSVISIQFSKIDGYLSIKNRYNHSVINPDATFGNNLENIIPGLSHAFSKYLGIKVKNDDGNYEIINYKRASDKKLYRFNVELNNICYGPNNIIIDNGKVIDKYQDKAKYIVIDYFIIDLEHKNIIVYDESIRDSFIDHYSNYKKLDIKKLDDGRVLTFTFDNRVAGLKLNRYNQLISIKDNDIENIDDAFLWFNDTVLDIEMKKVKTIGNNFLSGNTCLNNIDISNINKIGDKFLNINLDLNEFSAEKLEYIGNDFMYHSRLDKINIPNIKIIGDGFLYCDTDIECFNALKLEKVGSSFLYHNKCLKSINTPLLKEVGSHFLANTYLEKASFESLEIILDGFMYWSENIKYLNLPKARIIGESFLGDNSSLKEIHIPNLQKIGSAFLKNNLEMLEIDLPKLVVAGNYFLNRNKKLHTLNAPNLTSAGLEFLFDNNGIKDLELNSLRFADDYFMANNEILETYIAPLQEVVRVGSFYKTKKIKKIVLASNCDIFWGCFATGIDMRQEIIENLLINGIWEKQEEKKLTLKLEKNKI